MTRCCAWRERLPTSTARTRSSRSTSARLCITDSLTGRVKPRRLLRATSTSESFGDESYNVATVDNLIRIHISEAACWQRRARVAGEQCIDESLDVGNVNAVVGIHVSGTARRGAVEREDICRAGVSAS